MKHINTLFIMVVFLSTITHAQTIITYDKLGRVTAIEHSDGTQVSYTYDNVGNRLTHLMNTPLYWTGTTSPDWNTTTNWGRGTVPQTIDNVIINSGTPHDPQILSGQSATCKKLTIETDASLTVKSNNTGTGSLIVQESVSNDGSITVERYLTEGGWHPVSPSTTGVTANDFYWNDAPKSWLTYYTESTGEWTYNTELSTSMPVGQGWSVWLDTETKTNATTTMTGDIRTTNLSVFLNKSSTGWNLIGNPYTSAIDWDEGTWGSNTTGTVYVWDNDYNGGDYRTWNGAVGDLAEGIIPISQGFFVQATSAGNFAIPSNARVHSATDIYKSPTSDSPYFRLQMDFENFGNTIFFGFPENGTSTFDMRGDAEKLYSHSDSPQIYIVENGAKLSTNALAPLTEEGYTVPLHLDQVSDGTYTFTLSQIENLPGVNVILEDRKQDIFQEITKNPVYSFTASSGDDVDRFLLHFSTDAYGIEPPNNTSNLLHIYSYAKDIYIQSFGIASTEPGIISVFNLQGQKIAEQKIVAQELIRIPMQKINNYVIVEVTKPSQKVVQKVFIQ